MGQRRRRQNIEEVNLGIAGANYGWNVREGTFLYDYTQNQFVFPLPANDSTFGFTYPAAQYDHDEGYAIIGGFVYRGSQVPQLFGKYIFGDIKNGRVFYTDADSLINGHQYPIYELTLTQNGVETTLSDLVNNSRVDLRFGLDQEGEIYVLTKSDGLVRKLVPDSAVTAINTIPAGLVNGFELLQNYPNPFNPQTTIGYRLSKAAPVKIAIFDNTGKQIQILVDGVKSPGYHEIAWDGRNAENKAVASGIYFYRLTNGAFAISRKMILLR